MTRSEFTQVFGKLTGYFKANLTQDDLEIYYWGVSELDIDEFKHLCGLCVKQFKFMPKLAEMLELIEGKEDDKVVVALEELNHAVRLYGRHKSVKFADKAIMGAVENFGGWQSVCDLEGKDLDNFKKFDFPKLYKTYLKLPHRAPKYLVGTVERTNNFNNQTNEHNKIYFIGEDREPMGLMEFKKAQMLEDKPILNGLLRGINKAVSAQRQAV